MNKFECIHGMLLKTGRNTDFYKCDFCQKIFRVTLKEKTSIPEIPYRSPRGHY